MVGGVCKHLAHICFSNYIIVLSVGFEKTVGFLVGPPGGWIVQGHAYVTHVVFLPKVFHVAQTVCSNPKLA